jgi:hypothetical protein
MSIHPFRATSASIAAAKREAAKERADVLDAVGPVQTLLESVYKDQLEESYRRDTLADQAAHLLHGCALDTLPHATQTDLRSGAAYLLRRPSAAWRQAAQSHAEPCVAQLLREALGLSPDAAKALAVQVLAYGVAAYQSMLEGHVPVPPGRYLRIVAQTEQP